MKKEILNAIASSTLVRNFVDRPSPKWMVYVADLVMIAFSCLVTLAFGYHTGTGEGIFANPWTRSAIAFVVYAILSAGLGTSRYIIRLSVIEDTYRIVLLVLTATVSLSLINFACYMVVGYYYLSFWNVVIIGVMAFSLMLLMRLSVKYFYVVMNNMAASKKRVIVLGSAINSFFLASALKIELEGRFNPVSLLSMG